VVWPLLLGAACGTAPPRPTPATGEVTRYDMEPVQIRATQKDGQLQVDAFDAQELFDRASTAYREKRLEDAAKNYQTLLESFATSPQARAAHYNLGLVFQDKGEWALAAAQFRKYISAYPDSADAKDAHFQLGSSLRKPRTGQPLSRSSLRSSNAGT
jgi:TolA-binding protein